MSALISESDWAELLHESDADSLFNGKAWQDTWWSVYAETDHRRQVVQSVDNKGRLEAFLPIYFARRKVKGLIRSTAAVHGAGNYWGICRSNTPIRSEHLGIVALKGTDQRAAVGNLCAEMLDLDWDEFLLTDWDWGVKDNREFVAAFRRVGLLVRVTGRHNSYSIDTTQQFSDYLQTLSANARRAIYNKREYAKSLGPISIQRVSVSDTSSNAILEKLNELHAVRWGKPAITGDMKDFHLQLAERVGTENCMLSAMFVGDECISVLYNILCDGTLYNFQSGFDAKFDKGLSPMTLHIGYEIEAACESDIRVFHLLAGRGQRQPFKRRFMRQIDELYDVHIVRSSMLKLMYACTDMFKKSRGNGAESGG